MRKIILTSLLLSGTLLTFAQKLPTKQTTSIYAPANVKIDGRATEWGKLQAFNLATEITYTMANDNDKLYFVFSAAQIQVIEKVLAGGITLTVSAVDNKTATPVAITYPIVPFLNVQISYNIREKAPLRQSAVDSVNNKISGHLKEIKVSGIKEITENSISVYNELGIKGAQYVGADKLYTCELALPLSYIKHLVNSKGTFNYNIQVNGLDMKNVKEFGGVSIYDATPSDQPVAYGASYNKAPTYFNAQYTLASK